MQSSSIIVLPSAEEEERYLSLVQNTVGMDDIDELLALQTLALIVCQTLSTDLYKYVVLSSTLVMSYIAELWYGKKSLP